MKQKLNNFQRFILTNFSSSLLLSAYNYAMTFTLLFFLGLEEFGIYSYTITIAILIETIVSLSASYQLTIRQSERCGKLYTPIVLDTTLVYVFTALLILPINYNFNLQISFKDCCLISLISYTTFLTNITQTNLVIGQNNILILRSTFTRIGLEISLLTILFWKYGFNSDARLSALIFSNFIFFIIYQKLDRKLIYIDINRIKKFVSLGLNLVPYSFGKEGLNIADRIMLKNILGYEYLSVYVVLYQLASVLRYIFGPIMTSWSVRYFKIAARKKLVSRVFKRFLINILKLLIPLIFINLALAQLYLQTLDKDFIISAPAVNATLVLISLGILFSILAQPYIGFLQSLGQHSSVTLVVIFSLVVNISMNLLFINYLGLIGAAVSTLIAYLIVYLCTYRSYRNANISNFG